MKKIVPMSILKSLKKINELRNIKFFLIFLKYDIKRVSFVVFLSLLYSIFEGAGFGAIIPLLQSVSEGGATSKFLLFLPVGFSKNFIFLLCVLLFIFIIKHVIGHYRKKYQYRIAYDFIIDLRKRFFESTIKADIAYFSNAKIGNLTNSIITEANSAGFGFITLIEMFNFSLILFAYVALMIFISWKMTAFSVIVVIVASFFLSKRIKISKKYKENIVSLISVLNSKIIEIFNLVCLVKASSMENEEVERIFNLSKRTGEKQHQFDMNGVDINIIFELTIFSTILLMFYFSVEIFRLPLSLLAIFMILMMRIMPCIQSINSNRHVVVGYAVSLENVLNGISMAKKYTTIKDGQNEFKSLVHSIEVKDVYFSYNKKDDNVLNRLNLKINKGEFTAIIGSSGSGKSTLVDLILRFYDPVMGQIIIDGMDLKELNIASFRKNVSLVSQDIFLFNDTILANIRYGTEATLEEIVEAAEIANASEFIEQLPEKYETLVGDRGLKLSGGQKQRLALARAVARRPKILILDEATSSLDNESERLIQNSLERIGKKYTIIAIAHRLSTIEKADKIAVLEKGTIVEEGTHESLLKDDNYYYSKYYHGLYSNNGKV